MKLDWWKWLLAVATLGLLVTYCDNKNSEHKERTRKNAERYQQERSEDEQRYKNWAFIEKSKAISETETLKQIVIPGELGKDMDKRCLVYQNTQTNQATFTCPDISQGDLEPISEE